MVIATTAVRSARLSPRSATATFNLAHSVRRARARLKLTRRGTSLHRNAAACRAQKSRVTAAVPLARHVGYTRVLEDTAAQSERLSPRSATSATNLARSAQRARVRSCTAVAYLARLSQRVAATALRRELYADRTAMMIRVLHRDRVEGLLQGAAMRPELPSKLLAVHSLRAGGCSAMYNAGFSEAKIQQRGRWVSSCWKSYVFEGRTRVFDTAPRMSSAVIVVVRDSGSAAPAVCQPAARCLSANAGSGPRQPPSLAPAAGSSELPVRGARRPGSGAAVALAAV